MNAKSKIGMSLYFNRNAFYKYLVLIVLHVFISSLTYAENLNEEDWKRNAKNVDYTETYKEIERIQPTFGSKPPTDFSFLKIPVLIIIIVLLAYLLYKTLESSLFTNLADAKKQKRNISLNNFEDHIEDADLPLLLKSALDSGLYYLALRIHYLILVKSLDRQGAIHWKKDKTNGDYLYEMSNNPLYSEFAQLTYIFEKVWYGDIKISSQDYHSLSTHYELFNSKIKRNEV